MARVQWRDELNTGIEVIDNQHRRIVDLINLLDDTRHTDEAGAVGRVMNEVIDYTLSHLAFEESLMEDAGYEFARAHKRVHELFVRRATEFQERHRMGEDVSAELGNLLSSWLFNHIRRDDADYVPAVRKFLKPQAEEVTTAVPSGWLKRSLARFFA